MQSYILDTYLLSMVGALLYCLFIRNQLPPLYQKITLFSIIALSLLCPPIVDSLSSQELSKASFHEHAIDETVYSNYCPPEAELFVCYQKAQADENFCDCTTLDMSNILVYEPNPTYDVVLSYEERATPFIWGVAGLVFLLLLAKIGYLLRVIAISRQEILDVDGQKYTLLHPSKPLAVGSFQLWKKYIIWQKELDELDEAERKAVLWHEISHLEQKDTWLKIGLHITQFIWVLNPIYYFILKELDQINEYVADEFAAAKLGNKKLYASLLVKMKRAQQLALVHHFNTTHSSLLKVRVQRLIQKQHRRKAIFLIPFMALLFTCFAFTTYYSLPVIHQQLDKIEVYQTLSEENQATGKPMFCKNCLIEKKGW